MSYSILVQHKLLSMQAYDIVSNPSSSEQSLYLQFFKILDFFLWRHLQNSTKNEEGFI